MTKTGKQQDTILTPGEKQCYLQRENHFEKIHLQLSAQKT